MGQQQCTTERSEPADLAEARHHHVTSVAAGGWNTPAYDKRAAQTLHGAITCRCMVSAKRRPCRRWKINAAAGSHTCRRQSVARALNGHAWRIAAPFWQAD